LHRSEGTAPGIALLNLSSAFATIGHVTTPEQLRPIGGGEQPTPDREAREAPQRGDLYYLWHPGTEDVFSGYGLVVEDGKRNRLVGLLLVDRPVRVDPAWLASVKATFGRYELRPMTATGQRGILCEMLIGEENEPLLRQFAGEKSSAIQRALLPLLDQPPLPCFRLTWDAETHTWHSRFHLELPQEMRAVFANLGAGCFAARHGDTIAFVTHASEADIESFHGTQVLYGWELYQLPSAPVIRLRLLILDDPDHPFLVETFLNVGDEEQREYLESLASQRMLPFDFFGEDFTYRYTKELNHPSRMRRNLAALIRQAAHYWDTLPASERDFDRAKAEFQRQFPL